MGKRENTFGRKKYLYRNGNLRSDYEYKFFQDHELFFDFN